MAGNAFWKAMMQILTLDFETFFTNDYTLTKLTIEEYCRDPRFQAFSFAVKPYGGEAFACMGPAEVDAWIRAQDWAGIGLIAHNACFDVFILAERYNAKPKFVFDTLSMAHAVNGPLERASLEELAKRYGLPEKTVPYGRIRGCRWEDMDNDLRGELRAGALKDVEITEQLFRQLINGFPKEELRIIDLTVAMYTQPRLCGDVELFERLAGHEREEKDALLAEIGLTEADLQSTAKLLRVLESYGETDVPRKKTVAGSVPQFAAKDDWMLENSGRDDAVGKILRARLAVKSTLEETRANRLAAMSKRGPLPVYQKYFGAITGRWAGGERVNIQNLPKQGQLRAGLMAPEGQSLVILDFCIAENQKVLTKSGPKAIQDISLSDEVWDGYEFVTHQGVVCRGTAEVITYQGLTATPDHIVYSRSGMVETQYEFAVAARLGIKICQAYPSPAICTPSMLRSILPRFQKLWGTRYRISVFQRAGSRIVGLGKFAARYLQQFRDRSYQQRWSLRGREFKAVYKTAECGQSHDNSFCTYEQRDFRPGRIHAALSRLSLWRGFNWKVGPGRPDWRGNFGAAQGQLERAQKQDSSRTCCASKDVERKYAKVYDIMNCGPRKRFMVSGVIVSNCQVEYRILCALAGQTDKLDALASGRDLYCEFGSKLFGRAITRDDVAERNLAKTIVLGCLGPDTQVLTNRGSIPITEVRDDDWLWDGINWIQHQGLSDRGDREVIQLGSLWLTPDHLVLCGNRWVPAERVNHEEFRRALEKGSASLPFRDTRSADLVDYAPSWSGVRAALLNTVSMITTYIMDEVQGVIHVLKKLLCAQNGILLTGIYAPIKSTEPGYLTEFQPSKLGAARMVTEITGNEVSCCGLNGRVAGREIVIGNLGDVHFWRILLRYLVGTILPSNSTESTTIKGMSPATFALAPEKRIQKTDEKFLNCSKKLRTYDLVCAGPRKRFTVMTPYGPVIVHNSGYGQGKEKCAKTAKAKGFEFAREITDQAIDLYRSEHRGVVAFWRRCDQILPAIAGGWKCRLTGTPLRFAGHCLILPNGLKCRFDLTFCQEEARYFRRTAKADGSAGWGDSAQTLRAKGYTPYWGGGLVEFCCQALARIRLSELMLKAKSKLGLAPVFLVHDEFVTLASDSEADGMISSLLELAAESSPWWPDNPPPYAAEGRAAKRYGESDAAQIREVEICAG